MRIITWNTYRGRPEDRLAELAPLQPDVVCLQEVGAPDGHLANSAYIARTTLQGILLWARDGLLLEPKPSPDATPDHLMAKVSGDGVDMLFAGVWTHPEPSYTKAARRILDVVDAVAEHDDRVVLGDFNSSAVFKAHKRGYNHSHLVDDYAAAGLESAYHRHHGVEHGEEADPTYFWRWKETSPFHIDYCFLGGGLADQVSDVTVLPFGEFNSSDHRPMIVDLANSA